MRRSEFDEAVAEVLGDTYGTAVTTDLYLVPLGGTARELLDRGADPQQVWEGIVRELDLDPELAWVHRSEKKRLRRAN
ncbi:MAG: DUF3046 domain-containing protein [Actinomycetaceae bacterium]|nr:DUF3046 domain-containing protein [Actinomycetaceae bacterium]